MSIVRRGSAQLTIRELYLAEDGSIDFARESIVASTVAMSRFRLHVLALLGVGLGTPLFAQERTPASLEVSAGIGFGRGGTFRDRTGIALDATLGWRIRQIPGGAMVLALTAGVQGNSGATDICVIAPAGGCVPAYPLFYSVGTAAGWEWVRGRGASARVPQGQVDVATPAL
jgi:hypothetical protein